MGDNDDVAAILDRVSALRVLVVGDLMLDEYREGRVERMSPEAPVPVVGIESRRYALGGAGNVARNVVSLGASCDLVGVIGVDDEGTLFREAMTRDGLDRGGLVPSPARPTTHKLRVVAESQQLLRLDRELATELDSEERDAVRERVAARIEDCDLVILEDYDKGLFANGLAHSIIELARKHDRPVIADPKNRLHRFRGATLVKPNLEEARRFVPEVSVDLAERMRLLEKLRFEIGGGEVVVTCGEAGMSCLDRAGRFEHVRTEPLAVYDVQGAGDTAVAALGLARVAGASLVTACIVANAASAVAVEKIGTAAVGRGELRDRLASRDTSSSPGRGSGEVPI